MQIESITSGPFETNSYLLISKKNYALLIDPTFDTYHFFIGEIEKKGLKPLAILLTHSHLDHIADVAALKASLNLPVYVHELDQKNLAKPGSDGLPLFFFVEGVEPDVLYKGGEKIRLEDFEFEIIHTPGHSFGSSCFYFKKDKILISGDTLFKGTIGNLSFPTSEPDKMWESLKKLSSLDSDTAVWPGHGDPTTIGQESWLEHAKELFGE